MERISTDLPVPDPPTTPRISPRRTVRSRSSWITWSPNWFLRPRTTITGSPSRASRSDDAVDRRFHQIQPIFSKKMANTASSTMTRKMPCTTAAVVFSPTCSASPETCIP